MWNIPNKERLDVIIQQKKCIEGHFLLDKGFCEKFVFPTIF